MDTLFNTVTVSGAGTPRASAIGIARGTKVHVRVLVRNVSAVQIFLGGDAQSTLTVDGPGSTTYQLDPDDSEVFVLAPGQTMYAIGAAAGGAVSVSVSDALPRSL